MKNVTKRGFTLIELITVIAITAILLTIIMVPVIQSFNLVRAAQGFANAQSKARELVAQIEGEIQNAAGVRDNTGIKGSIDIPVPGQAGPAGPEYLVRLPYAKLDILKVAQGDAASRVGTAYIDPDTGKVDPTLKSPKGQPRFPAVPGDTIVRYFVGLRDPSRPYFNPYVPYENAAGDRWMGSTGGRDNLFVLYRAEVRPYIWVDEGSGPELVVNTAYFIDQDRDGDVSSSGILLDDPSFFVWDDGTPTALYPTPRSYDPANRNEMVQNWKDAATIVTELTRYDMVMPKYNPNSFQMQFIGDVPALVSLVRFQPTRVAQETASPKLAVGSGEETENAVNIGADVFDTEYPNWSGADLMVWPSNGPDGSGPLGNSAGRRVSVSVGTTGFLETQDNGLGGQSLFYNGLAEVFNVTRYQQLRDAGAPYPFAQALNLGNLTGAAAANFVPVVPNESLGQLQASFPIQEIGSELTDGNGQAIPYASRIPSTQATEPGVFSGPEATPNQAAYDPAQTGGLTWNSFSTPNERFAVQWNLWDSLWPGGSAPDRTGDLGPKRFIDLRQYPQYGASGSTPSPLSTARGWVRAQIVPGSVEIYAPDQRPGPNYGQLVRYTEVPNAAGVTVGPNQFKVNYTYKANEPDWVGTFGFGSANYAPGAYNAGDFLSATVQAKYRPGYVEFNSAYGEPIPQGNIYVSYRFQFTDSKTIVAVDYDSSELMEVVLSIRNYPQTSVPNPQMITVRGTAAVKNGLR